MLSRCVNTDIEGSLVNGSPENYPRELEIIILNSGCWIISKPAVSRGCALKRLLVKMENWKILKSWLAAATLAVG